MIERNTKPQFITAFRRQSTRFTTHFGRIDKLLAPLVFIDGRGNEWRVPDGFETDYASIPWVFRRLIPAYGFHAEAATLHDYLYCRDTGCTRDLADTLFLEALAATGNGWTKRQTMYWTVRLFAWWAYNQREGLTFDRSKVEEVKVEGRDGESKNGNR